MQPIAVTRYAVGALALYLLASCAEQTGSRTDLAESRAANQCLFANDVQCDEPGNGSGTSRNPNSCSSSFNGQCDEPGFGSGLCPAATDGADCRGDYGGVLFGNDDRVEVDSTEFPWSAIGQVIHSSGRYCTGSVVAPRLVLTAAQCMFDDPGSVRPDDPPVRFLAGADEWGYVARARVIDYSLSPRYNHRRWLRSREIDDLDWAFLVLDRNVGQAVGILDILPVSKADLEQAAGRNWFELSQAGYSSDRGNNLTAHIDCRITAVQSDRTVFHECDTLFGDDGSPLFVKDGETYRLIAIESAGYPSEAGIYPMSNLAVDSRAFYQTFLDLTDGVPVSAGAPGWPLRPLSGGSTFRPDAPPFGSGSGFYVNRAGDLVTNYHVINTCGAVGVKAGHEVLPAEVVAFDRRLDIAVLRTATLPGRIARLRAAPAPVLGQQVYAVGYPLSGELASINFTDGLVSSLTGFRGNAHALQTSAAVQPGNSGGPLLDRSGAVVGIVASVISDAENVGFAIRADSMIDVLRRDGVAFELAGAPRQERTEIVAAQAADFTYPVLCYAGE
ncbi:MAG: trypsin-like serine protease [Inquilinus sp.]|nr:trypsin-like serine protease [Inquilinus sp.]